MTRMQSAALYVLSATSVVIAVCLVLVISRLDGIYRLIPLDPCQHDYDDCQVSLRHTDALASKIAAAIRANRP